MPGRRPFPRLPVALVLGLVTALFVHAQVAGAARWGAMRRVPVVARPVAAGRLIGPDDVRLVDIPSAAVPDAPVASDAVGRAALAPLSVGEVLLALRVAPGKGLAALVPPGRRAVTIPRTPATPAVEVGDRVDVVGGDPPGTIGPSAQVVAVDDRAVTVAVGTRDAPALAAAVLAGQVSLALIGPDG